MPAAAVIAVASVAGAAVSASGAKSAAGKQARALARSQDYVERAAKQARIDVLSNLDPGMQAYMDNIEQAEQAIIRGDTDIMSILQDSTGRADQILSNAGVDAQRLIMGSQAVSRGMPISQFEQSYSAGQIPGQAPPPGTAAAAGPQTLAGAATPTGQPTGPALGEPPQTLQDLSSGAVPVSQAPQSTVASQPQGSPLGGVGYNQARMDLSDSLNISRAGIQQGRAGALGQLARGEDILAGAEERGLARTSTFSDAGRSAAEQEAALSGALGPEAQQAALDSFIESPGQKFLRERQEKSLLRNQAATGGLGGGRVLTALQEQAQGIASTQQQQQLANLGTIAQRGAGIAAGEQGFIGQMSGGRAGMAGQAAGIETQAAQDLARIESLYGPQMSQLAMQTGMNLAQIQQMTEGQRAGLMSGAGSALANVRGGTYADIARLLESQGLTQLNVGQQTGATLANIATQSGTQLSGLEAQKGASQAAGTMAATGAIAQGITGLGAAGAYGLSGGNPYQYNPTNMQVNNTGW